MIVIADTSPVNYLVLIHAIDLLPQLFGKVFIPPSVFDELRDLETPSLVRDWITNARSLLPVRTLRSNPDPKLDDLECR